ncbi:hypothetical protein BJY04DRAFT_222968 [Aspergillus karnatakaensis]|uniref:uncharacterized protein n=1 Tax=Aspergillus karnatakaensis TaxID=1810916 RepID=UPI003CCE391B
MASCHALVIFLSNNYGYYDFWQGRAAPRLSPEEQSYHVACILQYAQHLVTSSTVSSVLLLFPLRVAGTQAEGPMREVILGLLDYILAQGFVVARRIKDDLHEVWEYNDSLRFDMDTFIT